MVEKVKNGGDIKFWLYCLAGSMAAYVVFLDRYVPDKAIWDGHLWFLAGPFIFGVLYKTEFFTISFFLLAALGVVDLITGMDLNVGGGPSCWSGFEVWVMTIGAGLAGCLVSLFALPKGFLLKSHSRKN